MSRGFKNTVIKAPAGSGKTTKLVERFIELIRGGRDISEVVAITFTNKATGEMLDRIIQRLLEENYEFLQENYFSRHVDFRISTIHSFLKNLLSMIDPFANHALKVVSAGEDRLIFEHVLNRSIKEEIGQFPMLDRLLRKRLIRLMNTLHEQLPVSLIWADRIVEQHSRKAVPGLSSRTFEFFAEVAVFFRKVFEEYSRIKAEKGLMTYADMVYRSHQAVTRSREFSIDLLAAFNEKISAMLLDEFQDTDSLQWETIETLVEDWISGEGLREVEDASVFFIGDPMQSIYGFRGADPSIMERVIRRFKKNLEGSPDAERHFEVIHLDTNYRSLPAIVGFVNDLFENLFEGSLVTYTPFKAERKDPEGIGEVVVFGTDFNDWEVKKAFGNSVRYDAVEAEYIARKIRELVERGMIYNRDASGGGEAAARIKYSDIAILVKTTTNNAVIESTLSRYGIPFVSEDTGFTSLKPFEFLRNFFLLSDPLLSNAVLPKLLSLLGMRQCRYRSVYDIGESAPDGLRILYDAFVEFKKRVLTGPYKAFKGATSILEPLLKAHFNDSLNSKLLGHSLLLFEEIFFVIDREGISSFSSFSRMLRENIAEITPKISHDLDAVSLMTIHKAKGLEFPVVFVAGLHRQTKNVSFDLFLSTAGSGDGEEDDEEPNLNYRLYMSQPKDEHFYSESFGGEASEKDFLDDLRAYHAQVKKEYDEFKKQEEIRLFYVAFTRARDRLYISLPDVSRTTPAYKELKSAFFSIDESSFAKDGTLNILEDLLKGQVHSEKGNEDHRKNALEKSVLEEESKRYDLSVLLKTIGYKPSEKRLLKKTEPPSRRISPSFKFAPEVSVGKIVHECIAEFGTGVRDKSKTLEVLKAKLLSSGIDAEIIESASKGVQRAMEWLEELKKEGSIIGFEVPFVLITENEAFKEGRMDLLFRDGSGTVHVVDFKFEPESEEARSSYEGQISNYINAVKTILNTESVVGYLKFLKE